MKQNNGQIDWTRTQQHAASISLAALESTIRDIQDTLANADAMDRESGGCLGGYYRDAISVYRGELKGR